MAVLLKTPNQVPDHSILDTNGKMAYLEAQFITGPDTITLGSATETNVMTLTNPDTNSVALFVSDMNLNCQGASDVITFRIYAQPTSISAGTAITPRNCRIASSIASVATAKSGPTTGTKGTRIQTITVAYSAQSVVNPIIIIDPGYSILITAQATTTGVAICQTIHYEK